MDKVFWCKNCLNMSTRPRITFDKRGWCNACQWMEEKKIMDWGPRQEELKRLLAQHRSDNGDFDCIVPVSGGKDGSYVAYQLKHTYNMTPLTVTVTPALSLDLGDQNLKNFISAGFDHIQVNGNVQVMQKLNRLGFIEKGFPYYGWLVSMQAAVVRLATKLGISLIFYGEDGEIEYGGSSESKDKSGYDVKYMKNIYLEGGYDKVLKESGIDTKELNFWKFPSDEDLDKNGVYITHWSYFEAWDSYRNYLVAKEYCGLLENEETNSGTFTNFAQNDQALYALHAYLMYLKFGFGRATQDAGIEIRRGAMSREQAVNLVRLYDNQYPDQFLDTYLDYYQMTLQEFDEVLDKWVNRGLFEKIDGRWEPMFTVE